MMRRRACSWALALCLGCMAAFAPAVSPVAASTAPRWGDPVPLAHELPSSWFPDIQADPTGAIRLVWNANLAEGDGNLTHDITGAIAFSQLQPDGWSKARDIYVMDAGIASRPLIASDGTYAHILFRTNRYGATRLYYSRAPLTADLGNAQVWSEPQALSAGESYYAQIVILPDGALVAIYNAIEESERGAAVPSPTASAVPRPAATPAGTPTSSAVPRTVVLSRRSTDQGRTWSFATRVSNTDQRIGRTSLAIAPDGRTLVAAWDEGYDNLTGQGEPLGVGTARSSDGGVSWRDQGAIRSPFGAIEQSSVVVGRDGPLLTYRALNVDRLLYRTSADGGARWSEERQVPGAVARPYKSKHNFDKLGLASDGDGRVLLAYIGQDAYAPRGLAVMVVTFADGEWALPTRVAAPDGYPEYPRLAVALGNRLQLVYFVRDKEFDIGHYVLYGVAGASDARAIAPIAPQPAPPQATPVPNVPAVQVQPHPTLPAAPPPLPRTDGQLVTPQAMVNGPALRTLLTTLLALGALASLVLGYRWLGTARQ